MGQYGQPNSGIGGITGSFKYVPKDQELPPMASGQGECCIFNEYGGGGCGPCNRGAGPEFHILTHLTYLLANAALQTKQAARMRSAKELRNIPFKDWTQKEMDRMSAEVQKSSEKPTTAKEYMKMGYSKDDVELQVRIDKDPSYVRVAIGETKPGEDYANNFKIEADKSDRIVNAKNLLESKGCEVYRAREGELATLHVAMPENSSEITEQERQALQELNMGKEVGKPGALFGTSNVAINKEGEPETTTRKCYELKWNHVLDKALGKQLAGNEDSKHTEGGGGSGECCIFNEHGGGGCGSCNKGAGPELDFIDSEIYNHGDLLNGITVSS
jgi:hypothetical protein